MRRIASLLVGGFCAILALGGVLLTFFPAPRFSESENRYLAELPALSAKSIGTGELFAGLDTYATERAPFRGLCRALWSEAELLRGAREVHGVILCRDGSLSRRVPLEEEVLSRNLGALSRIRERLGDVTLTVAVVPRRLDARREVLPRLFDGKSGLADYALLGDEVITFPLCTRDEEWFRTDHHWTAEGAYHAYAALGEALGYTPFARETFTRQTVLQSFLGTSAAAAGIPHVSADEITLWRYEGDTAYTVRRDGKNADLEGLYDHAALTGGDPYSVFLGGNCGTLEIDLGEGDSRPTLLLIRDSFSSALLPFLARHFRILALDPRYRVGDLASFAARADRALVLCGIQTLGTEPFLTPLLRG